MSKEARKLITRIEARAQTVADAVAPRLTSRIVAHPLIAIVVACILLYLVITWGGSFIAGVRHVFEDRAVEQLTTEADEHLKAAGAAGAERVTEDANREANIRPQIETTTRDLEAARARRRKAESDYENARKTSDSSDGLNADALHQRNCTDLRELYPGEPVPYCDR